MSHQIKNRLIVSPFFLEENLPGLESLGKPDWLINKPVLPGGNRQKQMSAIYRSLADSVSEITEKGDRPVSIAGDCCAAIGVYAGLQRAGINPALIWFDAHGDFNTWETTPSGFLGGMPLAMMVGRGEQTLIEAVGLSPVSESQVILTDARDLDPGENELLMDSAVSHLNEVSELIKYPLPEGPIYIHVDTDIINPDEAPAMNYPAPGGPSAFDLKKIFRYLNQTGQIVAVSLSSWNPELDKDRKSERVCMELLMALVSSA